MLDRFISLYLVVDLQIALEYGLIKKFDNWNRTPDQVNPRPVKVGGTVPYRATAKRMEYQSSARAISYWYRTVGPVNGFYGFNVS